MPTNERIETVDLKELMDQIAEILPRTNPDEAKSALLYALKQLKISAAANYEN
ncbi:MAG: hypothetical protein V4655_03790 [Bdellovibrionota bacterium]